MKNYIYLVASLTVLCTTITPRISAQSKILYISNIDILFQSNHNIHKILYDLCFWASDPLIDRFY